MKGRRQHKDTEACTHPTHKLYAWTARDDTAPKGTVLVVGCTQCGAILTGGVEVSE
jgi:hypothetical protein